jgi:hypothetical protein
MFWKGSRIEGLVGGSSEELLENTGKISVFVIDNCVASKTIIGGAEPVGGIAGYPRTILW